MNEILRGHAVTAGPVFAVSRSVSRVVPFRVMLPVLACAVMCALACATAARAQFSAGGACQAKAADLYDERGFLNNKALTIDGALAVSNSNGNVSYTFPLGATLVSGRTVDVSLTYCGSVPFVAYKEYASGNVYEPFARWSRFNQNRPAWIISTMGFAVQILGTNTMFHCDPARFNDPTRADYDDRDMIWLAEGAEVCSRAEDLINVTSNQSERGYTDVISLMRADGSVLRLYNRRPYIAAAALAERADLFTGYYVSNAANDRAYGIVGYDSTIWQDWARRFAKGVVTPTFPYIPRVLHYFDGNGLEYVFRERVAAYGAPSYRGSGLAIPTRFGGMKAQPTVFYLEEVHSNDGPVIRAIGRSRHLDERQVITLNQGNIYDPLFTWEIDTTVGRALVTDINDVHITYGDVGLTVEAAGRTSVVQMGQFQTSGNAPVSTTWMPLATRGYFTSTAKNLATKTETGPGASALYEGYLGYVTRITDAEGRATTFEYEPYTRMFKNFGFPIADLPGVDVTLTARNLRLTAVTEPYARTTIAYTRGDIASSGDLVREDNVRAGTIRYNTPTADDPFLRTNVASVIRRFDRAGAPLTETRYEYRYSNTDGFWQGTVAVRDKVTDSVTTTVYDYRVHTIADSFHLAVESAPRFTELHTVTTTAAGVTSTQTTDYQTLGSPYVWLPTSEETTVAGIRTGKRTYSYSFDTLRHYGGNDTLTQNFGLEVRRAVGRTLDPATLAVVRIDTTDYTALLPVDTSLIRLDTLLDKFATYRNYKAALDSGAIHGFWEEWMTNPRVAVFTLDSASERTILPPQYGMVRRRVIADSLGTVVAGQSFGYTAMAPGGHYLNDFYYRGRPERDTLIGAGGAIRLGPVTTYTRGMGLNVPETYTAANGATSKLAYGSYSSPKLRVGGGYFAHARILYNDGVIRDSVLPHAGAFSILYNQPMATERRVRRYDAATGALTVDTLLALSGYTFHGRPSVTVDPSGVVTLYDYDRARATARHACRRRRGPPRYRGHRPLSRHRTHRGGGHHHASVSYRYGGLRRRQ